ncbi:MAG: proton-conducting transporter membrane subunit [Verrucomicrobiota bacterium]
MNLLPLFVAVPLAGAFLLPLVSWSHGGKKFARLPDLLSNLITFSLLGLALSFVGASGRYIMGRWEPPIGITLVVDGLTVLMLITVALVSFMATLFSVNYMEQYTSKARYYSLFMLMLAGMNGMVITGDLFNLFVFMEIASIACYALVGFGCEAEELEASFKYMVISEIGSALVLLAIAVLYGILGTLNMAHLARSMAQAGASPGLNFCLGLLIAGFGIKAALVPFHAWLPDAHPSAPAPISAMLSGVVIKVLGIYAMIRVVFNVFGFQPVASALFIVLGATSMVLGILLAAGQWDIKRLFAYSSISQVGYILVGVGLGTPLGILGGLFHLVNHSVFKSLLFLNSGALVYELETRDLKEMGGLRDRMPVTANTSLIASMSISGIPPFNGFWSKLIIILACVQARRYALAACAVFASIVCLVAFAKVQRYAFLERAKEKGHNVKEVPALMTVPMVVLALLCVGLGLLLVPGVRALVLQPAVEALLQGPAGYADKVLP